MNNTLQQLIIFLLFFAVSAIGRTVLPAPEPLASQLAEITEITQQETCPLALCEAQRDGTAIARIHDVMGRVTHVYTFPDTASLPADPADIATDTDGRLQQEFVYDGLARMVSATDYNENGTASPHTVTFAYDGLGQQVEETQDTYTVSVGYDSNDLPISLDYPSGAALSIIRDACGQATHFNYNPGTGTFAEIANLQYDLNGRIATGTLGSGIDLSRSFDERSYETLREYRLGETLVLGIDNQRDDPQFGCFTFDQRGNLRSEIVSGAIAADAKTDRLFFYDERDRLIWMSDDGTDTYSGENIIVEDGWQLDKLGNWTSRFDNGSWADRAVEADNEYTSVGTDTPFYDDNGNLVGFDGKNFIYDWADRLIEVQDASDDSTLAEYAYDALGRRVTKEVGATTTRYVYSGSQVIEEYENAVCARRFVLGPGLDQSILFETPDTQPGTWNQFYYLRNRQGSIIALTNTSGVVVESYSYTPYGVPTVFDASGSELQAPSSALANPYGYTGRRWDAESALWHYRNRMYSSTLGRFLTRDPAGFVDGLNLYQYVRRNPLAFIDPWGLGARIPIGPEDMYRPSDMVAAWSIGFAQGYYEGVGDMINGAANAVGGTVIDAGQLAWIATTDATMKDDYMGMGMASSYGERLADPNLTGMEKIPVLGAVGSQWGASGGELCYGEKNAENVLMFVRDTATATGTAFGGAQLYRTLGGPGSYQSPHDLPTGQTPKTQTFRHYGYADDAAKFEGGLRPGSYATHARGRPMHGATAQQKLALPHEAPPNAYYKVRVGSDVPVNGPGPVQPTQVPVRPGGGIEYTFPQGTPPGSIEGPFLIP